MSLLLRFHHHESLVGVQLVVTVLGPVRLGRRPVRLQLFLLDQVGQERHDGRGVQEEEVKQAEVAAYTKKELFYRFTSIYLSIYYNLL